HSVGSAIAIIEAGTYHDVDAVLVTGLTHGVNVLGAVPILSSLLPASLDPKFLGRTLDLGYLTTIAGTRYSDFHQPGLPVPGVDNTDEDTKDMFAAGEVVDTVLLGAILPYSRLINVPVMLVMGNDPAFCGFPAPDCSTADTLYQAEAPDYAPEAHLRTFVVRSYGHSLNLAPDAPTYHAAVVAWADETVGR
ncbi:alpha/beta hydrolase, partial [Kibdelosporangium lantanae]